MGKRYNGAGITQTDYFQVVAPAPLDDRFVVRTQADLFDINTWTINDNVYTYSGLCVSVVLDSDTTKNGIYMLIKSVKYDKQSWDTSAENYDAQGWMRIDGSSSSGNNDVLWVTFTKAEHSNGTMTCDTTYANIVSAFANGSIIVGMYQPAVTDYMKQYFTIPTKVDENTFLFTNQTPNDANEVLFITMTSSAVTLIIDKDYAIPDVANNTGRVLTANASNDSVEWRTIEAVLDNVDIIPSMRTVNNEPLTNESLGNINVHDGYYFPNAVQDADGNWYGAVVIGNQVWLGENLKTTHYYDSESVDHIGTEITLDTDRFSPNGDSTTVNRYGYLYTGTVVTSNSDLLDSNWRIPSADDWALLDFYLYNQERFRAGDSAQNIAKSLATNEDGVWTTSTVDNSVGKDTDENNTSGFNAFPAGTFFFNASYGFGNSAVFWSSTNMTSSTLLGKTITYDSPEFLSEYSLSTTDSGVSIRCVSNLTPEQFRAWYVNKYGTMQHHVSSVEENVQPDWNQTDTTADDYIKNKPDVSTLRTMNHEQLTDSSLGDINIHDGYYFPNAVQDYDGNWYGAVVIGDQVWFAENLRTTHYADGTVIPLGTATDFITKNYTHVNNDSQNDPNYGLLYNFAATTNGVASDYDALKGTQGVSPTGWHIPSQVEVNNLFSYVSKQKRYLADQTNVNSIAKSLAFDKHWNTSSVDYSIGNNLSLNNNTGFGALPAGAYENNTYSNSFGRIFTIWASSMISTQYGNFYNYFTLRYNSITYGGSGRDTDGLFSVRCISDLSPVQFRNWYIETYGSMQHHLDNGGEANVQSDWNQTDITADDYIKNKPDITPPVTDGNYVLTCTVNNGVVTYEWVSNSVFIQQ